MKIPNLTKKNSNVNPSFFERHELFFDVLSLLVWFVFMFVLGFVFGVM